MRINVPDQDHSFVLKSDEPLNWFRNLCHATSKTKGFWEASSNIPEKLCLIHSEVSEALEEFRKQNSDKEKFAEEIADILIRCFDLAGYMNIDLDKTVCLKMEKNNNRAYLHGKKF